MNTTPCSASRDEIKHDLESVEYSDEEIRKAEADAVSDLLRIVAPRSTSLIAAHHDGSTLVGGALSESVDAFSLKDITDNLRFGYATREHDDAELGRIVRKVIENHVRGLPQFQDYVDRWLAKNRESAKEAQLD